MYDQQPGGYPAPGQQPGQPGGYPPPGRPGGYAPPPQQPPGQQPAGAIAVTLKYHPIAFLLGLFKPQTEINGHPVAKAWGRQVFPVQPGQYHVHVHIPYFLPPRMGPADLPVTVYPGQTVELEYRAPLGNFFKGALGAPPQKWPGAILQIILLAIVGVILLCVCGGIIVSALSNNNDSAYGLPILQQLTALLRR